MKSHFTFSKEQRSGIFLLLLLVLVAQAIYFFVDFSSENTHLDSHKLKQLQAEVDSLKHVELEARKPKIYPFNPNYISDYKGYSLGMTNEEIDRLLKFREKEQWVNSAKEFQEVTKISDSLLAVISPYFKFPDWVNNPRPNHSNYSFNNSTPKTYAQKQDLNTASVAQLQKVNGIGEKLSVRIVNYRNKLGGFISDIQLKEVYGLSPEVIERVQNEFTVKTPKAFKTLNINTATRDELVTIQYIDYEIAHNIIEQRTLREGFKTLDELTKVKDFPVNKFEIIKLYLTLE